MEEYRRLEVGETIQKDDQVRRTDGKWCKTICAGSLVEIGDSPYRRRMISEQLIAAAPELLEVCKRTLTHLELLGLEHGVQEWLRQVIKKATE